MSRPEKFSTASAEALYEWAHNHNAYKWRETFAALRDEVAREVREECEKDLESLRADNLRLLMERVDILASAERAERERDAACAAVRAALVEEIVAKVEAMRTFGPVETFDGTKMDADNLASWLNKYELLDTIRGPAAPTTEEG
jgi:hypothetical protein